jgi:hypothetical protein
MGLCVKRTRCVASLCAFYQDRDSKRALGFGLTVVSTRADSITFTGVTRAALIATQVDDFLFV